MKLVGKPLLAEVGWLEDHEVDAVDGEAAPVVLPVGFVAPFETNLCRWMRVTSVAPRSMSSCLMFQTIGQSNMRWNLPPSP